jgi:hypothetical protein
MPDPVKIEFCEEDGRTVAVRAWMEVPRVGDTINFARVAGAYVVRAVHWGDHVRGDGTPIIDKPCAIVTVTAQESTHA